VRFSGLGEVGNWPASKRACGADLPRNTGATKHLLKNLLRRLFDEATTPRRLHQAVKRPSTDEFVPGIVYTRPSNQAFESPGHTFTLHFYCERAPQHVREMPTDVAWRHSC